MILARWHISDKMKRQRVLARSRRLTPHVIRTGVFKRKRVLRFVRRYRTVFIKPVYGQRGRGIIKVTRRRSRYRLHHTSRVIKLRGKRRLVRKLRRMTRGRAYMIQRGIPSLRIQGRPVDFRIMMLRPYNKWIFMGIMGRLAARHRIVTNFAAGGRALTLRQALKRSKGLSDARCRVIERRLISLGYRVAETFSKRYPGVRKLGIDVAIDQKLRLWILEPNTYPGYEMFLSLSDKSLYYRIKMFSKFITRTYYK